MRLLSTVLAFAVIAATAPAQTPEDRPPGVRTEAMRDSFQSAMEAGLEAWRLRLDKVEKSRRTDPAVRSLRQAWLDANQRLIELRRAQPDDWDANQARVKAAMDQLDTRWQRVADTGPW